MEHDRNIHSKGSQSSGGRAVSFYLMHRGWMDNPVFGKEPYSKAQAWVWLIENACFKRTPFDIRGKTIFIERGQLCKPTRDLAETWRWPETNVRRFLKRLTTDAMIDAQSGAGKTVITICNYDKYQIDTGESGADSGAPNGASKIGERKLNESCSKTDAPNGALKATENKAFSDVSGAPNGAKVAQKWRTKERR